MTALKLTRKAERGVDLERAERGEIEAHRINRIDEERRLEEPLFIRGLDGELSKDFKRTQLSQRPIGLNKKAEPSSGLFFRGRTPEALNGDRWITCAEYPEVEEGLEICPEPRREAL